MIALLTTPLFLLAQMPSPPGRVPPGNEGVGAEIEVFTQNLYVGADLLRVVDGPPEEVPLRVAQTLQMIQQTDFPTRVRGIAREIMSERPDVVALQEVSLLRLQSPGDFFLGNPQPAQTVLYDYLEILLDELDHGGTSYYVAGVVQDADVELPALAGFSGGAPLFDDVRLTDRDVILARVGVPTANVLSGLYTNYLSLQLGGVSVDFLRGFVAVEATVHGHAFRVVNTHLEIDSTTPVDAIQAAQADELIGLFALEELPLVIAGDFNSDPRHVPDPAVPPYMQMAGAGYVDAWMMLRGPARAGGTCCQSEALNNAASTLDLRFDLVWVRNAGTLGPVQANVMGDQTRDRVSGLWPSDHAGVFTRLHMRLPR